MAISANDQFLGLLTAELATFLSAYAVANSEKLGEEISDKMINLAEETNTKTILEILKQASKSTKEENDN